MVGTVGTMCFKDILLLKDVYMHSHPHNMFELKDSFVSY